MLNTELIFVILIVSILNYNVLISKINTIQQAKEPKIKDGTVSVHSNYMITVNKWNYK